MKLDEHLLPSYLKLHHPDLKPFEIQEKCRAFLRKISERSASFEDYFVVLDANRDVIWSLRVFPVQPGIYYAVPPKSLVEHSLRRSEFEGVIESLITRCRCLKARSVQLRLTKGAQGAMMSEILSSLKFKKLHERVEFKASLDELPKEAGTPLKWAAVSASGSITLREAAVLLGQAGTGDPDWSPDDDPDQLLKSYLAEEGLYRNLDAVQIGFIEGRQAAVVIAQVNSETGWSRITYMGVLPAFRGKGLGKWVQRRGFAMMSAQGGREYNGGTVSTNAAMMKLFRSHGCREFRRIEEWLLQF